jgi:hypothetical protein
MGGNLFKNVRRFEQTEFYAQVDVLHQLLTDSGLLYKHSLIKSYHNKPTFGDADFLVIPNNPGTFIKEFITFLNSRGIYDISTNSDISFVFNQMQVDLIITSLEYFDYAHKYFNYNDLGNLLGRLTHKLGLKHGSHGLQQVVRSPQSSTSIIGTIQLSTNHDDVLNILGLDVDQYNAGFNDLVDIFNFVASSRYFDAEVYKFEHRNNKNKVRDQKRSTYNAFLEWSASNNTPSNFNFKDKSDRGGYGLVEPFFTDLILPMFPHTQDELDNLIHVHQLNSDFKQVFNGEVVSEYTGKIGKDLGVLMQALRHNIDNDVKAQIIKEPTLVYKMIDDLIRG